MLPGLWKGVQKRPQPFPGPAMAAGKEKAALPGAHRRRAFWLLVNYRSKVTVCAEVISPF